MMIHNGKSIAKILRGNRAISKIIRAGQYIWQSVKYLFGYEIGGNAVVWNQLAECANTRFDKYSSLDSSSRQIIMNYPSGTSEPDQTYLYWETPVPSVVLGHTYLYIYDIATIDGVIPSGLSIGFGCRQDTSKYTYLYGSQVTRGVHPNIIKFNSVRGDAYNSIVGYSICGRAVTFDSELTLKLKIQWIDLTQMFGAGNEPTTYADFLARKPKVKDEYAYNPGKILGVGDEFAWNQLAKMHTLPSTKSGLTITYENGVPIINGTALSGPANYFTVVAYTDLVIGHKYLAYYKSSTDTTSMRVGWNAVAMLGSGDYKIYTPASLSNQNIAILFDTGATFENESVYVWCIDLTTIEQAMGITINSLEDFKTYLKSHSMMDKDATEIPYFGYDAGSVKTSLPIVAIDKGLWAYGDSYDSNSKEELDVEIQTSKTYTLSFYARNYSYTANTWLFSLRRDGAGQRNIMLGDVKEGLNVFNGLTNYDVIRLGLGVAWSRWSGLIEDISIVEGNHPISTTYPLLVSSPLYMWGSSVDVAKFGAGITRTLRKVDMGELSWGKRTDISPHMFMSYNVAPNYKIGLCPLATLNKNVYEATLVDGVLYWMGSYIMMYNSHYTSSEDFKEYVKGNQLLYELAEPVTEAIDLPKIVDYQPTILTTDTEVVGECKAFSTIEEELADKWGVSVDKVGKVDLGTMSWEVLTASRGECRTIDYIPNAVSRTPNTSINNDWVCRFSNDDKSFYIFGQHQIVFNDLRFANKTASEVKASLNGVILYYEKA